MNFSAKYAVKFNILFLFVWLELSPFNLPLRAEAYGGFPSYQHQLPGLIADALPDGWGLLVMDRLFKANHRPLATLSPLDRLAFIHDRAMGALVFEPADPLGTDAEDIALTELARSAQLVLADKHTTALKQLALLGGSPHGARPKVLVQFDSNARTISIPLAPACAGERGPYVTRHKAVWAWRTGAAIEIALSDQRGTLQANAGDVIVDYGGGDLAVVAGSIFDGSYERTQGPHRPADGDTGGRRGCRQLRPARDWSG